MLATCNRPFAWWRNLTTTQYQNPSLLPFLLLIRAMPQWDFTNKAEKNERNSSSRSQIMTTVQIYCFFEFWLIHCIVCVLCVWLEWLLWFWLVHCIVSVLCDWLEWLLWFWLVHCIVCVLCDWLEWLLWFWFNETQLKTALIPVRLQRWRLREGVAWYLLWKWESFFGYWNQGCDWLI